MTAITTDLRGHLMVVRGRPSTIPVSVAYNTNAPYAVEFVFNPNDEKPVTWLVSLELFECAFGTYNKTVGYNVRITLRHLGGERESLVLIQLKSKEGEAQVIFPSREIEPFIERALELATDDVREEATDAMLRNIAAFLQAQ